MDAEGAPDQDNGKRRGERCREVGAFVRRSKRHSSSEESFPCFERVLVAVRVCRLPSLLRMASSTSRKTDQMSVPCVDLVNPQLVGTVGRDDAGEHHLACARGLRLAFPPSPTKELRLPRAQPSPAMLVKLTACISQFSVSRVLRLPGGYLPGGRSSDSIRGGADRKTFAAWRTPGSITTWSSRLRRRCWRSCWPT
jgi:hypothetical protein